MTLVDTHTGEILDTEAAELRAEGIGLQLDSAATSFEGAMEMMREAIRERDDIALGYRSPGDYLSDRFGGKLARLGVDLRREVVRELTEAGLSTRAIAPVVGVSNKTVHQDLQVLPEVTPDIDPDVLVQARDLVISTQFGSVSMIQRKLKLGYALALRVMDQLAKEGVVTHGDGGTKARTVLVQLSSVGATGLRAEESEPSSDPMAGTAATPMPESGEASTASTTIGGSDERDAAVEQPVVPLTPVIGIDGKTYARPAPTHKPQRSPEQQNAEENSQALARSITFLLAFQHPNMRDHARIEWEAGQQAVPPTNRAYVTPNYMRQVASGLTALADEWENTDE